MMVRPKNPGDFPLPLFAKENPIDRNMHTILSFGSEHATISMSRYILTEAMLDSMK